MLAEPERPRPSSWRAWRLALLALLPLTIAAVVPIGPAAAQSGLDVRPSNTTCIAQSISAGSSQVTVSRAFAPLTFTGPTDIRQHPADNDRWYISERQGLIRTFTNPDDGSTAGLDIRDRMRFTARDVSDSEHWGIVSFVFHPRFNDASGDYRYLYVAYNRRMQQDVKGVGMFVSRFKARADRIAFDPDSELVLLQATPRLPWHHFGQLQFGPDGELYLASGDGGNHPRSQDLTSPLGKIIRFDVDADPPSMRLHAWGLRNPYRFSFDGNTLWAGDVGENTWEEIDIITRGGNYGWSIYEGFACVRPGCDTPGLTKPIHVFPHSVGRAVIGGMVYRGDDIDGLRGNYVFAAIGTPNVMALRAPDYDERIVVGQVPGGAITGFYADHRGELFAVDTINNNVWQLRPGSSTPDADEPVAALLSQTGCVSATAPGRLTRGAIPFNVNMSLWSDSAGKSRGMYLPNSGRITVDGDGDMDLPVGTTLVKTFRIDNKEIETRLFIRHPGTGGGWRGYSYEWEGNPPSDARLLTGGKTKSIPRASGPAITWTYPSRDECFQCHTLAAGRSLGLEVAQLNRSITYPSTGRTANQLDTWNHIGLFTADLPPASTLPAFPTRLTGTTTSRARAYLHANCSFCHRPNGGAQANIDFRASQTMAEMNVCDVRPLHETSFDVAGIRLVKPGDPTLSMVSLRMRRRDQYGMPPLASARADTQLARTIDDWIRLPGTCP